MNTLRLWDHNLFHLINNLAGQIHWLDSIAIFLAGNVFVALWALLIAGIWYKWPTLRVNVYSAFGSAVVSRGIIVELMKRIINRPRPYEALAMIHKLIADNEHGVSFPSGHTVIYFAFAFAFFRTKFFWPFFILACIASIDRVYVGVHYPTDILASVLIAWLTVWSFRSLFKNWKPV